MIWKKATLLKEVYDLRHNILEIYNVFVQPQLTNSKTKRDI